MTLEEDLRAVGKGSSDPQEPASVHKVQDLTISHLFFSLRGHSDQENVEMQHA